MTQIDFATLLSPKGGSNPSKDGAIPREIEGAAFVDIWNKGLEPVLSVEEPETTIPDDIDQAVEPDENHEAVVLVPPAEVRPVTENSDTPDVDLPSISRPAQPAQPAQTSEVALDNNAQVRPVLVAPLVSDAQVSAPHWSVQAVPTEVVDVPRPSPVTTAEPQLILSVIPTTQLRAPTSPTDHQPIPIAVVKEAVLLAAAPHATAPTSTSAPLPKTSPEVAIQQVSPAPIPPMLPSGGKSDPEVRLRGFVKAEVDARTTSPEASQMRSAPPVITTAPVLIPSAQTGLPNVPLIEPAPFEPRPEGLPLNAASVGASSTSTPLQTPHPMQSYASQTAHQIATATVQSRSGVSEISLNPEELGRVRMILTTADQGVTVSIQADRPETADLMRRNLELLAREFRDLGYDSVAFSFGDQSDDPPNGSDKGGGPAEQANPSEPESGPLQTTTHVALRGGLDLKL